MRLGVGSIAPGFATESIGGRRVALSQLRGRPVLIKFYRFATCPVCTLHVRRFTQEHGMVSDAGLTTVAVYHSPVEALRSGYKPGLLTSDGGITGNPADFIIDAEGRVAYARYGKHYADSLDATDVVNAWRAAQRAATRPKAERLMAMGAAF